MHEEHWTDRQGTNRVTVVADPDDKRCACGCGEFFEPRDAKMCRFCEEEFHPACIIENWDWTICLSCIEKAYDLFVEQVSLSALDKAARKAATTGNVKDLSAYLRIRRDSPVLEGGG